MSPRSFRSMIAMPILIVAMVAIPALLLSFTSSGSAQAQANGTVAQPTSPLTPTPVPPATPTPYVVPMYPIDTCIYFVQPGDTLSAIALRAHAPMHRIMQINGITNPNHLLLGQRLVLPGCEAYAPPVVVVVAATATATTEPTATATTSAVLSDTVNVKGYALKKVIGNRLSSTIYGYTDNGWLFRSPDNGESWMLITTNPVVQDFVMSPADPNVLYSGTGQDCSVANGEATSFYKSVNGGMTFVELANGSNLRPMLAQGSDKNILFAADCKSPYLTTDGGFTWEEKVGGKDSVWNTYHVTEMSESPFVGDPTPEQPNWDHIYAAGESADGSSIVAYSTDIGTTWEDITPKTEASMLNISALDADPMTAGMLWTADDQGVWEKAGVDESWTITFAGLQDLLVDGESGPAIKINDVVAHPDGSLYLATPKGLYTLAAGDSEWTKVEGTSFDGIEIYNILFTDSSSDTLWLNTASGVFTYEVGK